MIILNSLVSADIFSISYSMKYTGFFGSVCLMTLTAILSYITTVMTVRIQYRTNAESLQNMANKLLGSKISFCLGILTLLFTYSCSVAYLIIGGDNIKSWLSLLGYPDLMVGWKRSLVMLIYSISFPVLFTIPRKLHILSHFSTLSIFCLVIFVIVLIYKSIIYFPDNGVSINSRTFTLNMGFFNSFAIYSLMFALPAVILPILKPTYPGNRHRYRIVGTAFISCFLCVLIPGSIGYLMFGNSVNQIILSSFQNNDIVIQIVRISFFIVVTASYPIIALSITTDLSALLYKKNDPSVLPTKQRAIILFCSNAPPILIAMVLPNIAPILSIGGSLGGCLTNFFFPGIMWLKNSSHKWYYWTNLFCIGLSIFGFVSACIATYQSILEFIKPDD
jgi:amino acid permease